MLSLFLNLSMVFNDFVTYHPTAKLLSIVSAQSKISMGLKKQRQEKIHRVCI